MNKKLISEIAKEQLILDHYNTDVTYPLPFLDEKKKRGFILHVEACFYHSFMKTDLTLTLKKPN
jgi:hypothetical protein